ncbi:MAG: bifunctional folylpolyglutamate synthase/dihydrofolate synthase [Bacteroidales bacterium]|nr:bifunctional folylpolyglutamate synthase/dihydrofolate synthase [Bacteroidales bacterium]
MSFDQATYDRLLEEIFVRFPSVQSSSFDKAYKPGLERMEEFVEALGHPERKWKSIHVAGTNGKGTVASMLASVLSSCGYKTGLYTSPHLVDFRERARIPGAGLVPREYVKDFLTKWKPWFIRNDLSFFEITTGLAFSWFADSGVDVAVIEAGLGGRLDSTNVITPELSVVTSIGLDHCQYLGSTKAAIASEKAGIFKAGVQALAGESDPEAAPVFEAKARDFCPLTFADRLEPSLWPRCGEILREADLCGPCVENNLRTALAAVDILKGRPGFERLSDGDAVVEALKHTARRTDFHGRWEKLDDSPLVIADIGHNPAALKFSFDRLRGMLKRGECSSLTIVYGVMADKDLDSILPLMPEDAHYIFTAPSTPRALPAEDILSRWKAFRASKGLDARKACVAASVRDAVLLALSLARETGAGNDAPPCVFIGGSAFAVAEALPLFNSSTEIKSFSQSV